MPWLNGRFPKYRLHRHSGQAVVTLNGGDQYLGPFDSPESKVRYDRLIGKWLAHGRQLPHTQAQIQEPMITVSAPPAAANQFAITRSAFM